jgi:hypothetical protein
MDWEKDFVRGKGGRGKGEGGRGKEVKGFFLISNGMEFLDG